MNKSISVWQATTIAAVFAFIMVNQSVSEAADPVGATAGESERVQGVEQELPVTKARLKLQSAYTLYAGGDIGGARKALEEANQWLGKAIEENGSAKEQTRKLANEIQALSEQLTSDSEQQQNAIARFWHQSTALVTREMEDLIHRYAKLSATEKTPKPLLDAKMHLVYAKHDLFDNHNAELAEYELGNVLQYLDDASEEATPEIKQRITEIKSNTLALKDGASLSSEAWHSASVYKALNDARARLEEAKEYAAPTTVVRIDNIKSELASLQKDIVTDSAKQHYDSVMYQLVQLINDL